MLYIFLQAWQPPALSRSEAFDVRQYSEALHTGAGFVGTLTRDDQGVLMLSGLCNERADLTAFLRQLEERNIAYRNQVVCADELRRSVVWILHRNGYPEAQVKTGATLDAVIITANLNVEDPQWSAVSQQLSQLPGLQTWRLEAMPNDVRSAQRNISSVASVVKHASSALPAASAAQAKADVLSALFRSASRISAWLGFPDTAGYWSIKALEQLGAQGIREGYVSEVSQHYQIPLPLARAVIWIESRGRHIDTDGRILTSSKGALGIMQLMPETARELKVNPLEVHDNIRGGFAYLAQLARKYQRDWDKVVAAYNWGPGNIDEAIARYGINWRSALPKASVDYLSKVQLRTQEAI